ncbi:MAG TPA: SgcJ/EcaC family oxidoreductase [Gemmatimonadaceae bacterium]|jgi:conserved hypothetical protein
MTILFWSGRVLPLGLLARTLLFGPALLAQQGAEAPAARDTGRAELDTAAILASARPEIDAANAAWLPGLREHDAGAIAAAYADSGLFISPDGTVTRGREAIRRMYAARFPRLRPIRDGGVVQGGLTVLGPMRIAEWGYAWIDLEPERGAGPPARSGGTYLTVWDREADGHWRIVRNLAF